MNVRTRLTLAFFAISVVPLAAVTAHTYVTSKRALQQAATQKADALAAELGHRMEWVTADLERRMDRVWPTMRANQPETRAARADGGPAEAAGRRTPPGIFVFPPPSSESMTGHMAGALGEVAPMIESLELVPAGPYVTALKPGSTAPSAPGAPTSPSAPASGGGALVPRAPLVITSAPTTPEGAGPSPRRPRPQEAGTVKADALERRLADLDRKFQNATPQQKAVLAGRFVVEMSSVVAEALKPYGGDSKQSPAQNQFAAWSRALQEQIQKGTAVPALPSAPSAPPAPAAQPEPVRVTGTVPAPEPPDAAHAASDEAHAASDEARRERWMRRQQAAEARAAEQARQQGEQARQQAAQERFQTRTVIRGSGLDTSVQRNGQEVGRIRARLNYERMFGAILPMTRRDEGEIPFAIDADGRLHGARGKDRDTIKALNVAPPTAESAVRAAGDWVVVTRKDKTGVTFGIARPIADDLRGLRRVSAQNFAVGFGLIALVFLGSVPLAGSMTRNLRILMDGVRRISKGDLSARVTVKSRDEFGQLATMFNQMAASLSEHEKLVVQQERLQRELELCRQIQTEMLPHAPLRLGVAEINGVSIPAREVGGDFFNYFVLPHGDIALLVGDVSGKGVGAALLMANVQATLRARLPLEQDLAHLADALDHDLGQNTPAEVFLTLFVGILDPVSRRLRYVNAGHNTQFALRAGGGVERMASTGMPLGLLPGHGYEEHAVLLDEGDVLFFYTDGTVEMANEAGDLLGAERLESVLLADPKVSVDALLARVESEIAAFRGTAEPTDDATMMALRISATRP